MIRTPEQRLFGWSNKEEWDGWGMWHVGGKKVVHTAFWWGDVREKDHSEDLGIDGKIIILFYIHVTVHRAKFLITKPTRCNKFSNLFLEWNSTCFGQFLSPSLGVFHCTHSSGICHTGLLTYTIAVCTVKNSWWWQRNCPKHVDFHSNNKFEKLVHLVGFIIRNLSRCTVTWTSNTWTPV